MFWWHKYIVSLLLHAFKRAQAHKVYTRFLFILYLPNAMHNMQFPESISSNVSSINDALYCGSPLQTTLMQLDSENSYTALVYGTSALVTIWISSIVVSALDSVPLVCNSDSLYHSLTHSLITISFVWNCMIRCKTDQCFIFEIRKSKEKIVSEGNTVAGCTKFCHLLVISVVPVLSHLLSMTGAARSYMLAFGNFRTFLEQAIEALHNLC